jgi:hypothetical protein
MSALTVLIIRHGEKPDDPKKPGLGPGLTEKGVEDIHSLAILGWQRAGAWAALFASPGGGADFPKPDIVYAADPGQPLSDEAPHGKRAFQTVIPLCERLHIKANTHHGVHEEDALVAEVRQLTGVVLICWEHKRILKAIVPGLTKGQAIPHLPGKWSGSRFDVALRFDRAHNGAQWSFRQLSPRLLAGDSDTPVDESA